MTQDNERDPAESTEKGIDRRTVLKSAAAASFAGFIGVPSLSGGALGATTETLYLSDSGLVVNDNNGSKLFEVDLDDAKQEANLTLLVEMDAATGGNDWYDQVDAIAASLDGSEIYAIDKLSKRLGIYDVDANSFSDKGPVSGLPDEAVQAAFSPGGALYVASDTGEDLYILDPSGPEVTETVELSDDFDVQGADIVFGSDGTLYIFTNGGDSNGVGLYKIDDVENETQPISPDFVGVPEKPYYTGLAVRDAGDGNLVASAHTYDPTTTPPSTVNDPGSNSNAVSRIFTINRDNGSRIESYDTKLGGNDYYVGFGDMTVGALDVCEDLTLDLCAGQDIDVGTVTISESGGKLNVTYDLNSPWTLCESHVDVGDEFGDFHTNGPGNPQVGQFDLSDTYDPCVSEFPYQAFSIGCDSGAFSDVDFPSETLKIAVHSVVRPADGCTDFSAFEVGESVEGLGTVIPSLDVQSTSSVSGAEAVAQKEGVQPATYGAPNGSASTLNGCLDDYHDDPNVSGGFSDLATKNAAAPHAYEFTVANDVTLSDFSLRMLDFGDFNPSKNTHHYAAMVAYDENGNEVDRMELEYYTMAQVNPTTAWNNAAHDTVLWSNLQEQGDACDAATGEPGNWVWQVGGDGIVKVVLTFGDGHDPNIAFTDLCFTADDETAWTCEGQDGVETFVDRGNWATYFTYALCDAPGGLDCNGT